ncbi:hypothetical protein JKP88DRAFT_289540 [Tribonema minus]|uniref:Uncharacterized protein n=1 Tax=Tribonema minus TaxID=303371 RepID=A0A835Z171_9STRA|nr:hypothetical protein JKP88DRAFT_289540 [Tribonema minus]
MALEAAVEGTPWASPAVRQIIRDAAMHTTAAVMKEGASGSWLGVIRGKAVPLCARDLLRRVKKSLEDKAIETAASLPLPAELSASIIVLASEVSSWAEAKRLAFEIISSAPRLQILDMLLRFCERAGAAVLKPPKRDVVNRRAASHVASVVGDRLTPPVGIRSVTVRIEISEDLVACVRLFARPAYEDFEQIILSRAPVKRALEAARASAPALCDMRGLPLSTIASYHPQLLVRWGQVALSVRTVHAAPDVPNLSVLATTSVSRGGQWRTIHKLVKGPGPCSDVQAMHSALEASFAIAEGMAARTVHVRMGYERILCALNTEWPQQFLSLLRAPSGAE